MNPQRRNLRTRSSKTPKIMSPETKAKESDASGLTPMEEGSVGVHIKESNPLHNGIFNKKAAGKKNARDSLSDSGEDPAMLEAKRPLKGTRSKEKKRQLEAAAPNINNAELSDEQLEPPKKKRGRAPKPEPVYVIPEIERKETTFHGRLGR